MKKKKESDAIIQKLKNDNDVNKINYIDEGK